MAREPIPVLAQGDRATLIRTLAEHGNALDGHDVLMSNYSSRINTLESTNLNSGFELINGDTVDLVLGTPVALLTGGTVWRANSFSQAHGTAIGLISFANSPTNPVTIQPGGSLELDAAQWDVITGDSGGLIPGATYFVSSVPGQLTTTPPSAPGSTVHAIGRALYSTEMLILLGTPVLL